MKIVKTKSGYKIKFGWWIFSSSLKATPKNLENMLNRDDAVFDTYDAAFEEMERYKELDMY